MSGYVYILSNACYPGLVKIGVTTRDVDERVRELSASTGVPREFVKEYVAVVGEAEKVERRLHNHLAEHRPNRNREFFEISPQVAIAALQHIAPNHETHFSKSEHEEKLQEQRRQQEEERQRKEHERIRQQCEAAAREQAERRRKEEAQRIAAELEAERQRKHQELISKPTYRIEKTAKRFFFIAWLLAASLVFSTSIDQAGFFAALFLSVVLGAAAGSLASAVFAHLGNASLWFVGRYEHDVSDRPHPRVVLTWSVAILLPVLLLVLFVAKDSEQASQSVGQFDAQRSSVENTIPQQPSAPEASETPAARVETQSPSSRPLTTEKPPIVRPRQKAVAEAQHLLTKLGYRPGPIDGIIGPRTRRAIEAFQRESGLNESGEPSSAVLRALRSHAYAAGFETWGTVRHERNEVSLDGLDAYFRALREHADK